LIGLLTLLEHPRSSANAGPEMEETQRMLNLVGCPELNTLGLMQDGGEV
jgi:hypothetical protein